MRGFTRIFILLVLCLLTLRGEASERPKHKRLHWLRRICAAEVELAERVSSIRLRGTAAPDDIPKTRAVRSRRGVISSAEPAMLK